LLFLSEKENALTANHYQGKTFKDAPRVDGRKMNKNGHRWCMGKELM